MMEFLEIFLTAVTLTWFTTIGIVIIKDMVYYTNLYKDEEDSE